MPHLITELLALLEEAPKVSLETLTSSAEFKKLESLNAKFAAALSQAWKDDCDYFHRGRLTDSMVASILSNNNLAKNFPHISPEISHVVERIKSLRAVHFGTEVKKNTDNSVWRNERQVREGEEGETFTSDDGIVSVSFDLADPSEREATVTWKSCHDEDDVDAIRDQYDSFIRDAFARSGCSVYDFTLSQGFYDETEDEFVEHLEGSPDEDEEHDDENEDD